MGSFIFDLQRFADVTIAAGETYALDGVTYTALTDAQLNLADGKVSGIASGKVQAVADGVENSPVVTFDGTTPFDFTCTKNSDALNVSYNKSSLNYTSGNVTYSGSGVTFQSGTVSLAGKIAKIIPYSVNLDVPTAGVSATFDGDNFNLKSPDTVTATLNLPEGPGLSNLLENLKSILPALLKVSEPTFEKLYDIAQKLLTTETSIKLSGEATYNKATKTLSLAQDSFADINAAGYKVNLKAVDGALDGISVYYQKDGDNISEGIKFAASSSDGKLKLDVLKNGVTLFDDVLKISSGTMAFDLINAKVSVDADTSLNMTVRDIYTANMTALNALSTTFSADEKGNTILTPENFSVKATLQRGDATIFDGTISIEKGSLFFNQESNSINITQGTTLNFNHSTHSVSLTATDDAGISIVAENDGNFTITPGEDDGSLDFVLSKGDTLVLGGNLSLSNGSLIFNPAKQEISFTKGTTSVITVGNRSISLTATDTATAKIKIDVDGNFIFTPNDNDGSFDFSLSELTQNGTNLLMKKSKSSDSDNEQDDNNILSGNLSVSDGSLGFNLAKQEIFFSKGTKTTITLGNYTFEFTATDDISSKFAIDADGSFIFTPGENDGSLNVVFKKGDTAIFGGNLAVSNGSIGYNPATQELSFTKDTKTALTLGNYTFEITATDDISSKFAIDADGNFIFTPGENDGSLNVVFKKGDTAIFGGNLAVSNGSIGYNPATQELSFTKDTKTALTLGNYTFEITATDDISSKFAIDADGNFIFTPGENDGSLNVVFKKGDTAIFGGNLAVSDGSIGYNPATQAISFTKDTKTALTLGNYTFELTATDDISSKFAIDADGNFIFTPGENDGSLNVVFKKGDTALFGGNLAVSDGSIGYNPATQALSFTKDTKTALTLGNYTFEITATDDISSKFTIDADGNFIFTPGENDGSLNVVFKKGDTAIFGGNLAVSDGSIGYNPATQELSFTKDTKTALTLGNYTFEITATDDISSKFAINADGSFIFTPGENDGSLNVVFKKGDTAIFGGNLAVSNGSIGYNPATQELSFTKDTKTALTLGNYTFDFTATDDISSKFAIDADGSFIFTPGENDGSLNVVFKKGDTAIFGGNLAVSDGSIGFNPATQELSFTKDTKTALTLGNYTFDFTATDDISSKFAIDADGNFIFTPGENDGSLNVVFKKGDTAIFGGNLAVSNGSIGYNPATQELSFTKDTKTALTLGNYTFEITATDDISSKFAIDADGNLILTPGENDGSLNVVFKKGDTAIFGGNLAVSNGSIGYNPATQELSFTKDTKTALTLGNYTFEITATDDISSKFAIDADGNLILTPGENDGSLDLTIKRGDTPIFSNIVSVVGEISFNPTTQSIGLADGTKISTKLGDYEVTATADGDAAVSVAMTSAGLSITPVKGDGTLNLKLGSESVSLSANLEVLSGSFILGENGALTVTKDTELQIDFGGGYVVKFKTTDDAGGSISLGAGGLTFAPTEGDGHLELSVTRGGETRTTSLEMTGSLTYKLDGSISLAKDTVLKNVFEDGNELTITANTDANGSILFHPQNGLIITPATPDALNIRLKTDDLEVANISSITGTINYSGGVITASDGSQAHLLFYNNAYEIELRTNGGSTSFTFTDDRTVYTANEGATAVLDYLDGSTLEIQNGSFSDIYATDTQDAIELISEGSNFKCNDDEFVFTLDKAGNYTLNGMNVTTTKDNVRVVLSDYEMINVDGLVYLSTGDENATITLGEDGSTLTGGNVNIYLEETASALNVDATNGSLVFDSASQKFSFTEGTVLYMPIGSNLLQFVVKEDFSVGVEKTGDYEVSFKLDGTAELEIINGTRKTTLDFTGGLVYESDGKISLKDGTEINLTWEDGNSLKLTSHGSNGSILLDADKGVRITSDDENLDMTLTTAEGYSSTISSVKGSLWYKAGTVTLDADTFITGKNIVEGHEVGVKFEAIGGTGKLNFANTGFTYSAGTGKNKVTYTLGDAVSSFIVNKGSVFIQGRVFNVAEGSDIATDFKDFIPAQYFKTGEAGTYTINGKTIETTAANLQLIATDDYMSFKTSDDVVKYNGMTFAGAGNVSLSSDNVVLGAGVEATGFGEGKSFVLAEAGNVTADAKVFELTQVYLQKGGESIPIPMIITVTGAQDGFIFSRTLTEESEEYLGETDSPYVGQVFTEKFISAGDSSYRTRTDPIGLEEVIGISDSATVTGGASLADEKTLSYYNLVTDTEGKFTIGEKTYTVSGDSSVVLRARFEENAAPYASMVDSLNGTISGDFSGGNFSINGSSALKIIGDSAIDIVADKNGYEILGLDAGASLQVSKADTYKVNGTEIAAGASAVIVGTPDNKASLYTLPAGLADFMLHKTEAGYPQMAALAFHPDEENPDAPTNYHSVENWTADSTDNLKLSAIHYSPENPTGKWVILVHGYGKKGAAMNAFAEPYLEQGLDVLIVDQRTAGDSEGDWLTMGVAEANDLAIWTQEIAKTNANAQITLHGVSMGAATVMLCAALPETTNLSAIIDDCGYGNIADVFTALMSAYGSSLGVSGDVDLNELFDDVGKVAKTFDGGYDISDAAPIDSIAAVTVPSLFIHGASDAVIPSSVASALYEKSGATNKTKLIIEGAGHAQSVELDTETYLAAVKKLIDSSTKEIGASIDSDVDNKLLRGTIYNDTINNSGTAVTIEALGGDDYITNNVDSSVTAEKFGNLIETGDGNDTVYNHHSYNPTIYGGAGDDSIVVSRGHKTFADGGDGNDSIIGRLADNPDSDWAMGGHATILGNDGDDYINTGYTNDSTLDGGTGNDTIITCGLNNTINGGDGKNLINMEVVDREDLSEGSFIVLNGQTTVNGFKTGFGEGTDTVYIEGESPAVDFKADGLTLYYDNDGTKSLTFSDIKKTAKLNLYYESSLKTVAEVFIADDEWYSVTEDDLSVMNDSELYFVGATAKMNHGIDFSGITDDVKATLLGHSYPDYVENLWINNIHSIKGGAGLTTITGSDKSDTILAGKGATTINAAAGDDFISLGSASALIEYSAGDGNDSIQGFRADSTLNISGAAYTSIQSGDNLIFTVDDDKITLQGAASLDTLNIIGKTVAEEIIENVVGNYSKEEIISLTDNTSQDIDLTQKDYDVAVVESSATGNKNISLGGGDLVVVEDTSANVSITASTGNDTVFSQSKNIFVSLRGGKTDFITTNGKMKIAGYDSSTDSGFHTEYEDILAAIVDGEISFDKGNLSIDSAVIDFNGLSSGVINFFNVDGDLQRVGFADDDASLDASNEKGNLILVGGNDSTLRGGTGKNQIYLKDNGESTVALNGRNTINNFNADFVDGDKISVDATTADFSFDGEDLTVKNGAARALLENISSENGVAEILTVEDGKEIKAAIAQEDSIITVNDELADIYVGKKSGVDFASYDESLTIDLNKNFYGINQITVGGGLNTLIASSTNETLTGNDDGTTKFVFDENSGRDLIKNFNFAEDKINVGNETITAVVLKESNVRLQIDGDDWLTLEDAQGKNFKINEFTAKVDKNIEYDDAVNFYVATSKKATLTVDDEAEIWLDGSHGKTFVGNIKTLDATNSDGKNILAGNDLDNTICAGKGDASLWGGNGGNDLLVGGKGRNMFFYAYGNGNDTINGTNSGDIVYLAGVTFDQIASTEIAQGSVTINFTDGGKLNVAGSNAVEFALEGATYLADHSTGTWQKK